MVSPGRVHTLKVFKSPWKSLKRSHLPLIEVLETNFNVVCLSLLVVSLFKAPSLSNMNEMAACGLLMNKNTKKVMASPATCL